MITLTIEMDDAGTVTVEGPLARKDICYSMLECARDIIKDLADAKPRSPIALAGAIPPLNGKRRH